MCLGRGRKRLKGHCGEKALLARSNADDKITWQILVACKCQKYLQSGIKGKDNIVNDFLLCLSSAKEATRDEKG